jgi:hypothetical protein
MFDRRVGLYIGCRVGLGNLRGGVLKDAWWEEGGDV